jgi:periplasmic protein TonB
MFESSLIDLEATQHPRRQWAALPIAIALHGAVLASVGVAQVWNVDAVGELVLPEPYRVYAVPEILSEPESGPTQQSSTEQEPSEPAPVPPAPEQIAQAEAPEPKADTTEKVAVLDAPRSGGPGNAESRDPWLPSRGTVPGPPSDRTEIVPAVAVVEAPDDQVLTVGGAVTRPVLLSGRPPRYPEIARRSCIEGTVILEALIDKRGRVSGASILKGGLPLGLDEVAVSAVREWIFEPAKLAERPVNVRYTLTVHFRCERQSGSSRAS